ncbi:hypothetical protein TWF694_007287 [Orbilia ellipsospora]|uniref:Uncharacterized protein n=1 Tax=Orbilia ellipsospora TaxID=2528407 RepID=A0AAV9XH96_9PEZI
MPLEISTEIALFQLRIFAIPGAIAVPRFRVITFTVDDNSNLVRPPNEPPVGTRQDPGHCYSTPQDAVDALPDTDEPRVYFVTYDYRLRLVKYFPSAQIRQKYQDILDGVEQVVLERSGLECKELVEVGTKEELLVFLEGVLCTPPPTDF